MVFSPSKVTDGSKSNIPGKKVPQGTYSAFVPAPLLSKLDWTPRLIHGLSDADRLIGKLAGEGGRLPNPHILMRPFLQREAVLSSKIDGTQATLSAGALRTTMETESTSNKISNKFTDKPVSGREVCAEGHYLPTQLFRTAYS